MKHSFLSVAAGALFFATVACAEFRQIDLTIFGMD